MNRMNTSGPYSQMYKKKEETQIATSQGGYYLGGSRALESVWSNHSEHTCTGSCSHVLVDNVNSVLTIVFLSWSGTQRS